MDAIRIIVVTSDLEMVEVLTSKTTLLNILQRALNTWSDIPQEILTFSDAIEKI